MFAAWRALGSLFGSLVGALALSCAQAPQVPPNLLLITIDTLRADQLACYGGPAGVGVAICDLADGGTRFVWALSAAPYTAPSIASVLTSQYPSEHGVRQSAVSYLAEDAVSVAEVLKENGYTTAAFVSNPVLDRNRHLQQGFDVYDQTMTRRERNRPGFEEREAEATADAAIAWSQVGAREPWFIWVHFQDPHGPYEPPSASDDSAPRPVENPRSLPLLPDNSGLFGIPSYQHLPGLDTVDAYTDRYLGEIRYLDPHVGRLVQRLDAMGRPPAVVLTSDHGEAFGEDDFYFAHGHSVGLDQIRVPLIWRPAAEMAGADPAAPDVYDLPVGGVDIAPTLLAAAGAPIPGSFRGHPLPVSGVGASAPSDEERGPLFAEHARRAAIVVGRAYYSRDRWALSGDTGDPTSGGRAPPFPARSAELGADGGPVSYELGSPVAASLEPSLAEFIERTPQSDPSVHDSVPAQTRERLRALGYLD